MTEREQIAAEVEAAHRPASELQGNPGHDDAEELVRGARLLRLRAQRLTYQQIADAEGYANKSAARQALLRALARHEAENAAELRDIENLALDMDERFLRSVIVDTEVPVSLRLRAVDSRIRLSARRGRLNGLDAPVAVQISAGVQAGMEDALQELEAVVGEVLTFRPREVTDGAERLEG